MYKGTHGRREYKYKGVSPILNELGSGGSRMYPHLSTSTKSYLRLYSQHTN